jgi:hypothetical protein
LFTIIVSSSAIINPHDSNDTNIVLTMSANVIYLYHSPPRLEINPRNTLIATITYPVK